jgi:uncharacterized protein with HEPN domain
LRNDRLLPLVLHIRDVAEEIAQFVATHSADQVKADLFAERGLVHSLYMIADLTIRLQHEHPEITAELPMIAWKEIRGLRNRIAHTYFELDHDVIWRAATNEVPVLSRLLVASLYPPHSGS